MNKEHKILAFIISIYMICLPIIPDSLKYMNVKLSDILLSIVILTMLVTLVRNLTIKDLFNILTKDSILILMIILCFIMFISTTYALEKNISIGESIRFLIYILLYFSIKYLLNNKFCISILLKSYIFISIVLSLIGIFQFCTGIRFQKLFIINYGFGNIAKETSTFENPNAFAAFLLILFFPIFIIFIKTIKKKFKVMYGIFCILIFTNIILTGSRNAVVALLLGLITLSIFYSRKFIYSIVVFGVATLFVPVIRDRISAVFDMSKNISRFSLWGIALKMIKEHPLLGVGNGNYVSYYDLYVQRYPELRYQSYTRFAPHNSYLKVCSELGIATFCIFIILLARIHIVVIKHVKKLLDNYYKFFYSGFIISMIIFLFMNLFECLFFLPKVTTYYWILIALLESLVSLESYTFKKTNMNL